MRLKILLEGHAYMSDCLPHGKQLIICQCGCALDVQDFYCADLKAKRQTLLFNPFAKQQILDASKLKEFAEENFKFDENGRKLSKCVENTVGKGEIACYEKLLVSWSFSKDLYCRQVKTFRNVCFISHLRS